MTERIVQNDNWSCFACVAGMITGKTLAEVVVAIGHDGSSWKEDSDHPDKMRGFGSLEIVKYLAENSFICGTYARFEDDQPGNLMAVGSINFTIDLQDNPAIVTVQSKRLPGCYHMIYWDGSMILDPSPDAGDDPPWSDYRVLEWWPVIRFE